MSTPNAPTGFAAVAGCAENATSTIFTRASGTANYSYKIMGNYGASVDVWETRPGIVRMWVNSKDCWGCAQENTIEQNTNWAYPCVWRGFTGNDGFMQAASKDRHASWTTDCGMGIALSALTKCKAKFSIPTVPGTGSRWDALIDIYLYAQAQPIWNEGPAIDIQIFQMLMDQPLAGQIPTHSGYYASVFSSKHGFLITLGGITYLAAFVINANYGTIPNGTVTLCPLPTMATTPATGLLWGQHHVIHDVKAIIDYFLKPNPLDDTGQPIKNGAGAVVTAPMIPAGLFLGSVNGGFELDFTTGLTDHFVCDGFEVAVQNEPDPV
jgi:hypothetical protein